MSISISMKNIVSLSNANASSGVGNLSSIDALQKKLVTLQNELKDAISTATKEGQAKAKLIQLQIAATQAQLDQLIQQKANESSNKQVQNKSESINTAYKNNSVLSTNRTSFIDEFA